jgi:hypothetical protein
MHTGMRAVRFALIVSVGVALSGCAADGAFTGSAPQATPYPPPGYSHTIQTSAVVLYWNCAQPEPNVVEVSGLAFNPWQSQPVRDLEIELVGVDSRERTVSEASAEARDAKILTNQSTPFQLRLRTAGNESRLDLYYRYKFQDGGRDWIAAGPGWDGPILLAQQVQFRVRDACSEAQHRVR